VIVAGLALVVGCASRGSGTAAASATAGTAATASVGSAAYTLVMDSSTGTDDPGAVWLVGAVSQRPRMLRPVTLVYPDTLKRQGIGGDVVVEFVVDTAGNVEREVRVPESANPLLAEPARLTIRQAQFRPGTVLGRRVRVLMTLRLRFNARRG